MERIDGPSLSARLAEGPMTDAEVTRIAGELADALSAVHAAGIVHRDVKPSNILLAPSTAPTRPPRAKLADFGIAHLLGSDRITQPGSLIGTAAYLAPEVALGNAPRPASDVYALGLVLLEALTGTRAFPSAQGAAQLLAGLRRIPRFPIICPRSGRSFCGPCSAATRPHARAPRPSPTRSPLPHAKPATTRPVFSPRRSRPPSRQPSRRHGSITRERPSDRGGDGRVSSSAGRDGDCDRRRAGGVVGTVRCTDRRSLTDGSRGHDPDARRDRCEHRLEP
jgi:serine/threonine protein kinase